MNADVWMDGSPAARHIAFVNIPMTGHVYPTLAVVAELVRRGHRVSYATIERRRSAVEAAGASLVPYGSILDADDDPAVRKPDDPEYVSRNWLRFVNEAAHTVPQLDPLFQADRPDLVVYDIASIAGKVLALRHGVPMVAVSPILVANAHWSVSRNFGRVDGASPAHRAFQQRYAQLLTEYGLPDQVAEFTAIAPARRIVFLPREFQYRSETFDDDSYAFVGPCLGVRPFDRPWLPPGDGRPVLYMSMGTVYNYQPDFYRRCVEAFADSPWHLVMAVGERLDPDLLGPVPGNVQVHRTVAQLDVLAHAQAFLSHAGMGGVMEALSAGVPLVTVPQTPEQEANAQRIAELGLGVRLEPDEVTAGLLRTAVDQVAGDGRVAERLAWMRGRIRAAGGTSRAADVIGQCLPPAPPAGQAASS